MNFLFGRIFWVIEIVQSCPATDPVTFAGASCLSYVADGTSLVILLPCLQYGRLHFQGKGSNTPLLWVFVIGLL